MSPHSRPWVWWFISFWIVVVLLLLFEQAAI